MSSQIFLQLLEWVGRPIAFGANCGIGPAELLHSVLGMRRAAPDGAILVAKGIVGFLNVDGAIRYRDHPKSWRLTRCSRDGPGHGSSEAAVEPQRNMWRPCKCVGLMEYSESEAAMTLDEITETFGKDPWATEGDAEDKPSENQDGARRQRRRT